MNNGHVFDPKGAQARIEKLIESYGRLALGLAKSALEKGLLLTIATQRNHVTGELDVMVDVSRSAAVAGLTGEADGEEAPLSMAVNSERDTGRVTIEFTRPIGLLDMDGDQAIALAQLLVNHAKLAGTTKQVDFIL